MMALALFGATACSSPASTTSPTDSATATSADTASSAAPSATAGPVGQVKTVPVGTKLNIWYINILTSYPAWESSMEKFASEADAGNYTATTVGTPQLDTPTNISQADQAIASGADGIIICDTDPTTWGAEIAKAQQAGLVVVTIGCVDTISNYSVGTDNTKYGQVAADQIAKDVGQDATVGIISTDNSTPNQVEQVNSFKSYIATKYPNMTVADWEYDQSQTSTAATDMTAMLTANPKINAIMCVEGNCPAAAPAGLREAGKNPGDVYVLGIDTATDTVQAMKDGWVSATLDQCWFSSTKLVTSLIRAAKEGNPSPQQSWPITLNPVTADQISTYTGCPESLQPTLPS